MIELSHISKEFVSGKRTVHAVQDVSLTIDKGEIFGMIGFSGAGWCAASICSSDRPLAR